MTTKLMILSTIFALASAGALQAQQPQTTPPATPAAAPAAPAVDSSAALYNRTCAGCHGTKGTPGAAMANSTLDFASTQAMAAVTDSALREAVIDGKGRMMPAYKARFSAAQIDGLVGYIRTLSRH